MRIGPFHFSEIIGGLVAVGVVSAVVSPTPVILGLGAFIFGQVVVRMIRKSRGL